MPEREQPAIAMHTLAAGKHTNARTHARTHARKHKHTLAILTTIALRRTNAMQRTSPTAICFVQVRSDSPGIFLPARWDAAAEQANVALVHLASRERIGTYCGSGV
jgi:hypothetical protein